MNLTRIESGPKSGDIDTVIMVPRWSQLFGFRCDTNADILLIRGNVGFGDRPINWIYRVVEFAPVDRIQQSSITGRHQEQLEDPKAEFTYRHCKNLPWSEWTSANIYSSLRVQGLRSQPRVIQGTRVDRWIICSQYTPWRHIGCPHNQANQGGILHEGIGGKWPGWSFGFNFLEHCQTR